MSTYRRQDVLRIFEIGPRQLQAWERAGLIPQQEIYSFQDLGQLRILCALRAEAVPAASIRESIMAMKAVSGMANPLLETRVVRTGSRIAFRHHGAMVDPVRGQLLFDFERGGQQENAAAALEPEPLRRPAPAGPRVMQERFLAAVRAEESSDKQRAIALYEEILSIDPDYAAACYQPRHHFLPPAPVRPRRGALPPRHRWPIPATCWPTSISATCSTSWSAWTSPSPPISRPSRSRPATPTPTITWRWPTSAAARNRHALRHWRAYVKLDNRGPWADHARGQIRKLLSRETLAIVSRANRFIAPRKSRAALRLA